MFNFIKKTASLVLANSIVVAADQAIRTVVETKIRNRAAAKRDHEKHTQC